jgi:hypothetical protein
MRHTDIREGDRLKLKPDNPYGIGPMIVTVSGFKYRPGYKVPHVIVGNGWAFKPRDFERHARRGES